MGSYASQLSTTQRWMVIQYVKSKQPGAKKEAGAGTDSTAAGKSSAAAAGAAGAKKTADSTAKK